MLRAEWAYKDANGKVLGYVKRFKDKPNGKKDIRPYFKPDSNGEFTESVGPPAPKPLFNIPLIINVKNVAIVEGEKCAFALSEVGIPATTSLFGAGSAKHADWTPLANVEKVFLLPDANFVGEQYVDDCAAEIRKVNPNCKFYIRRCPDVPDGGDIVDWIQQNIVKDWIQQNVIKEWDGFTSLKGRAEEVKAAINDKLLARCPGYFPTIDHEEDVTPKESFTEHTKAVYDALTFAAIFSHFRKDFVPEKIRSNGFAKCSSPFSSDTSASFDFHEKEKRWHCFSTGAGGRMFCLIAALQGCSVKGDFKTVMKIAEEITGIKFKGSSNKSSSNKSNVTYIKVKQQVDLDACAQLLASLPIENVTVEQALIDCSEVLKLVAASNGVHDDLILNNIKAHYSYTSAQLRTFGKQLKQYRADLVNAERGDALPGKTRRREEEATRPIYLNLYQQFLGTIRRDIFSGDLVYFNKTEGLWLPVQNEIELLKSKFREHGEKHDIKFDMGAVNDHLAELREGIPPELCVTLPEWDGKDRVVELVKRLELKDGPVDRSVVEELVKDWLARMLARLENPNIQNRIIVLKGKQRIGKDFWISELLGGLGQWAVPLSIEDNHKDARAALHTGLVMTIAEFDRSNKQHSGLIKDMITAPSTSIRFSYDRRSKFRYVRCSFIASCNVDDILRDTSGNTRFIIFDIEDIDRSTHFTSEDRAQVLAQAQVLSRSGFRANAQAESVMDVYVKEQTPKTAAVRIASVFDEICEEVFNTLSPAESDEAKRIAKGRRANLASDEPSYLGFFPKSILNKERIYERVAKRLGYSEEYVRGELGKTKRAHSGKWRNVTQRGLLFLGEHKNEAMDEVDNDNEDFDIPF